MGENEDNPIHCGAKTRSGGECMSWAMPNGKCRMHGGTSPGAPRGVKNGNYRHGFWTKEAIAERQCAKALISEMSQNLESIF